MKTKAYINSWGCYEPEISLVETPEEIGVIMQGENWFYVETQRFDDDGCGFPFSFMENHISVSIYVNNYTNEVVAIDDEDIRHWREV